jgi:hypothetical protein
MVFLFTSVSLYQRISTLDEQITQLTRHLALLTAREDPVDQKPGHE